MPSTTFSPAVHGFHFSNNDITWSFGPFKSKFLCGGMAYASLDYFLSGMAIPPDATAPPEGSPLHSYIYDRQLTAHKNTAPKFTGTFIPVLSPIFVGINELNVDDEFAKLNSILITGRPIPICLSTVGAGHHLLAIGSNPTPPIVISAYQPECSRADRSRSTGQGREVQQHSIGVQQLSIEPTLARLLRRRRLQSEGADGPLRAEQLAMVSKVPRIVLLRSLDERGLSAGPIP